ncbi:putative signal transducing protein [Anabaena sp. CCY 9402-a]|uniref:putative signal transducing protein n=1 Tax=Anabaena sp. CCY 9402-a TaxID=3103867 RepID=UPI0039C73544
MVNNFVTVSTFSNYIDANLAKQLLESQGIQCYLANESTVNMAWHLTVAVGWIKLQVNQTDLEQAKKVLVSSEFEIEDSADEWLQNDEADDDIEKISWADETADRAFRTSVIGLILLFLPIQIYSLWLLVRLLVSRRQISSNRRIKVIVALLLDLLNLYILWEILF